MLVVLQAVMFGGCVVLGMLTSAQVECAFTPVVVAVDHAPDPPTQPIAPAGTANVR